MCCSIAFCRQLAPAIKAVFDRGWGDVYESLLNTGIRLKDAKIRDICHENYEEFIGAVETLLSLKLDMAEIKQGLGELSKNVQDSGKLLIKKAKQLQEARETRRKINEAMDVLRDCKFVMSLAAKANEQVDAKKYFSALKVVSPCD